MCGHDRLRDKVARYPTSRGQWHAVKNLHRLRHWLGIFCQKEDSCIQLENEFLSCTFSYKPVWYLTICPSFDDRYILLEVLYLCLTNHQLTNPFSLSLSPSFSREVLSLGRPLIICPSCRAVDGQIEQQTSRSTRCSIREYEQRV